MDKIEKIKSLSQSQNSKHLNQKIVNDINNNIHDLLSVITDQNCKTEFTAQICAMFLLYLSEMGIEYSTLKKENKKLILDSILYVLTEQSINNLEIAKIIKGLAKMGVTWSDLNAIEYNLLVVLYKNFDKIQENDLADFIYNLSAIGLKWDCIAKIKQTELLAQVEKNASKIEVAKILNLIHGLSNMDLELDNIPNTLFLYLNEKAKRMSVVEKSKVIPILSEIYDDWSKIAKTYPNLIQEIANSIESMRYIDVIVILCAINNAGGKWKYIDKIGKNLIKILYDNAEYLEKVDKDRIILILQSMNIDFAAMSNIQKKFSTTLDVMIEETKLPSKLKCRS